MRKFERLRHIRYFSNCLQNVPKQYSSADTNRLTLVHFCVQALDILGCLPDHAHCCGKVGEEVYIRAEAIIEWIYGLQTLPLLDCNSFSSDGEFSASDDGYVGGGFKGGTYLGPVPSASDSRDDYQRPIEKHQYDHSHLAMTYVALCTLISLGDDLSCIHKTAILQTLHSLQKEDGSFVAISSNCRKKTSPASVQQLAEEEDDDCDLRFMYTAIAIWYLLTDPTNNDGNNSDYDSILNIHSATSYILSCISYDGAIGLTPGREGHGGSTFCGVASLHLMGVLDDVMTCKELNGWKEDLIRWCAMRQYSLPKRNDGKENNGYYKGDNSAGMQGRPNKLQDTCYSYWIGGTLHLLSESHLLDGWALREYVLTCQSPYGGFGKVVGVMPDLLHSFYSLAWLALSKEQGCCDEEYEHESRGMNKCNDGIEQSEKNTYDNEMRQQVHESIDLLSKLDCALGICTKRMSAFRKATMQGKCSD